MTYSVLGSYRLEGVLGEGSMGVVYLATHTKLERKVAIKVLRPEYAGNTAAIRRFFAEARAVNKVSHPNIVEVTDFFEQDGQHNYYVMELLEGASVSVLLDANGGPLPLERTVNIMSQLADALVALHRAHIVHRDIKPENVILIDKAGKSDFVKLCDFGVARVDEPGLDDASIHRGHGAPLGTPEYMSPEAANGHVVDDRTDVYSYGVMLYKLVTGQFPLRGRDFTEQRTLLLEVQPVPPRQVPNLPHEVPAALDALIMQCLAKHPGERPTMEQVAKRLEAVSEEQGWLVYELEVKPSARMSGPLPRAESQGGLPPPVPTAPVRVSPVARFRPLIIAAVAIAVGGVIAVVLGSRGAKHDARADLHAKVKAELTIADDRISAGRLVGPGGDEALDHLLAARKLDPTDAGVRDRLHAVATKFGELADDALKAGSLAEAAAHLQTVLIAEPDNQDAQRKMADVERLMLEKQQKSAN